MTRLASVKNSSTKPIRRRCWERAIADAESRLELAKERVTTLYSIVLTLKDLRSSGMKLPSSKMARKGK